MAVKLVACLFYFRSFVSGSYHCPCLQLIAVLCYVCCLLRDQANPSLREIHISLLRRGCVWYKESAFRVLRSRLCFVNSWSVTAVLFRSKITNKCVEIVVGFIDAFLDFPQHVSENNCHHQGCRSALEATQARSVLWMYMDYDSSSVISFRGM
jgi:hypothetical protein